MRIISLYVGAVTLCGLLMSACSLGGGSSEGGALEAGAADAGVETGESLPKPEAQEPVAVQKVEPAVGVDGAKDAAADTRYVVSASLWVRKGPGGNFEPVRALKRGDSVKVFEVKRIWAKIGEGEFVSQTYLSPQPPVR